MCGKTRGTSFLETVDDGKHLPAELGRLLKRENVKRLAQLRAGRARMKTMNMKAVVLLSEEVSIPPVRWDLYIVELDAS